MKRLFLVCLAVVFSLAARGQYNDTTMVVDGYVTNLQSFAQSGTNNLLIVTNGGVAILSGFAASNNGRTNVGVVTGNGSMLRAGSVAIGFGGSSNALEVVDGGAVSGRLEMRGTNNIVSYRNTVSTNDLSVGGRTNSVLVINSKLTTRTFGMGATGGSVEFSGGESSHTQVSIGGQSGRIQFRDGSRTKAADWSIAGSDTLLGATGDGTFLEAN